MGKIVDMEASVNTTLNAILVHKTKGEAQTKTSTQDGKREKNNG